MSVVNLDLVHRTSGMLAGESVREKIGPFAWRMLEEYDIADGLSELLFPDAQRVPSDILSESTSLKLAELPLPVLAKLTEITEFLSGDAQHGPRETSVRAAIDVGFSSLGQSKMGQTKIGQTKSRLDNSQLRALIAGVLQRIQKLAAQESYPDAVYLVPDTLESSIGLDGILAVLQELSLANASGIRLIPLGFSSAEIAQLGSHDPATIGSILEQLLRAGIRTIEGGYELDVHELAIEQGFSIVVGQPLRVSGGDVVENSVTARKRLIEGLCKLRLRFNHDRFKAWFPFSSDILDRGKMKGPLGHQALSAICLGRLILPRRVAVRASLSLFGQSMAHIALAFGASDLGFAAVDATAAEALALPLFHDVIATINEHGRFASFPIAEKFGDDSITVNLG